MRGLSHEAVILPLVAAFFYALATIFIKRSIEDGVGVWRVSFVCNMVMAIGYQACWVTSTRPFSMAGALIAALAACTFFAGQVFTFLALKGGDVSVATPIMGTKVIWVAGFSVLLMGRGLSPHIWVAVFLTAMGTVVLGVQPGAHPRRVAATIGTALAATLVYGFTDVIVGKYAPVWGFGSFIPTMYGLVGVLSLGFLPLLKGGAWSPRWLAPGSILLAGQALLLAYAIVISGHVTTVNIAYNSRGFWSVGLVWVLGHWFGNRERERGTATMLLRLAGAAFLITAVFLVSQ